MAPAASLARLRKWMLDRVARKEVSVVQACREAGISTTRFYELRAPDEGELGDEMHIVVEGVRVVRGDAGASAPVARRGPGDVVGEMSIITRTPRVASLVAESDVRTVRIGHREFETMIRERPDVALAVMHVLAERLGAETAPGHRPTA